MFEAGSKDSPVRGSRSSSCLLEKSGWMNYGTNGKYDESENGMKLNQHI